MCCSSAMQIFSSAISGPLQMVSWCPAFLPKGDPKKPKRFPVFLPKGDPTHRFLTPPVWLLRLSNNNAKSGSATLFMRRWEDTQMCPSPTAFKNKTRRFLPWKNRPTSAQRKQPTCLPKTNLCFGKRSKAATTQRHALKKVCTRAKSRYAQRNPVHLKPSICRSRKIRWHPVS